MIFMKRIAVIGLGNPLRSDDAIGIFLLDKLKGKIDKDIEIIDCGTGGFKLLHQLAKFDFILFIDAVNLSKEIGEYKYFSVDEVESNKDDYGLSTHENDLMKIINISRQIDEISNSLFVFGIQPGNISFGTKISKEIQKNVDLYVEKIIEIINENK